MENLKQFQLWLDTLSILGIIGVTAIVIYLSIPEIIAIASYFSPNRWEWIRTMLTNNNESPGHIPDHADGNFILVMYTARLMQYLIIICTAAQIFADRNMEVLIGEFAVIMLACLGIKYVPTLMRRSVVGSTVSEKIVEKITTTKKEDGKEKTEGTEAP